jgi:hypothetical protein
MNTVLPGLGVVTRGHQVSTLLAAADRFPANR